MNSKPSVKLFYVKQKKVSKVHKAKSSLLCVLGHEGCSSSAGMRVTNHFPKLSLPKTFPTHVPDLDGFAGRA